MGKPIRSGWYTPRRSKTELEKPIVLTRRSPLARTLSVSILAIVAGVPLLAQESSPLFHFQPDRREAQRQLEGALVAIPRIASLRAHHDLLSSAPHPSGTPGDREVIEWLFDSYSRLGLPTVKQELSLYLPTPEAAEVEILAPVRLSLPLQEPALEQDRYSDHPSLRPAVAGYSGSGDVSGQVVYANFGRIEDFERLEQLGIRVQDRIVVARYGEIFRGYKAHNAERFGAAALLLYTDPEESGWGRGISYPEGGWLNRDSIQSGSILTLPYPGDPLTPEVEATPTAPRLDPAELEFPEIPVQPISWGSAEEILGRMTGPAVPRPWQGGLPFAYRLTGGPELLVRVHVDQPRGQVQTANVVATLPGTRFPDQMVVIGSHHDAWAFGASDPNAGSIVVYEVARAFMELARRGIRTQRTLVFANWGAEELGIHGSTEWVEANLEALAQGGIAYINLDGAALGTDFSAAVSPSLRSLLRDVLDEVDQPGDPQGRSVLDVELEDAAEELFGALGGGSDHVAFYTHAGIPSMSLHAGGSDGSAYHTNYDTLDWYRKVVGDTYDGALMLSRIVALLAARLSNADVIPLDPKGYASDFRRRLRDLEERAVEKGLRLDFGALRAAVDALEAQPGAREVLAALAEGRLTPAAANGVSWEVLALERLWIDAAGLEDRPWYKSLYAAPDPETGYAPWLLPPLRQAIEEGSTPAARRAVEAYERVFRLLRERLRILERLAEPLASDPVRERSPAP